MKATNKQEFFELLGSELNRIGIEDTEDIFADFEEHFADSAMQGIPEDVTAERLGDIKEIARSYLNLESSRINSIMARDVERRKVSLTKPGRGVPADLSLIGSGSARDIANSDNIREYTPQHLSGEIYPQSPNSSQTSKNSAAGSSGVGNGANGRTSSGVNNAAASGAGYGSANGGNAAGGTAATENKSVADAFSDAGRAALDAAKITGQAVADAFKHSGVKEAVVGAGKSAADAVKSAGEAVKQAVKPSKKRSKAQGRGTYNGTVPHPSDTYRENMNTTGNAASNSRKATIPPQYNTGKSKKSNSYKLIDVSSLTPNTNAGKLVAALLMDFFLWSWLLPSIIGGLFTLIFAGGLGTIVKAFPTVFGSSFSQYYLISRLFLGFTFFWLGIAVICVAVFFAKLFIKLIKFIINLHIKAIYDL